MSMEGGFSQIQSPISLYAFLRQLILHIFGYMIITYASSNVAMSLKQFKPLLQHM